MEKVTRKFQYRNRGAESLNVRINMTSSARDFFIPDKYKIYVPKDSNRIRFLPPTWDNANHYGLDVFVHYSIGLDEASYICLFKMKNEPCPICEERKRAVKENEEEYASSLVTSRRVLVWLVDRDKEIDGPQLWPMPQSLDREISILRKDKRTGEHYEIDNPEVGYDVEFERQGKGISTRYVGVQISRRSTLLGNDDWLSYAVENPLLQCLIFHDYDYIRNVFSGKAQKQSEPKEERIKEDVQEIRRDATLRDTKEEKNSVDISYEELRALSMDDLRELARDWDINEKVVKDDELLGIVAKILGLQPSVKEEEKKESYKDKLKRLREGRTE